ncbi:MAG: hypothetical protein IT223_00300, partial [Crocinitomicaceae bacterium]|nr:hypothetical protein [Crocinitomicaceae bacterium]
MKINYYLIAGLLLFLNACKKDESTPTPSPVGGYLSGIYVANEGNFLSNNASVTFISDNGTVMEDPYFDVNGVSLGDVLLQFLPLDGKGYAVVNNSQKV